MRFDTLTVNPYSCGERLDGCQQFSTTTKNQIRPLRIFTVTEVAEAGNRPVTDRANGQRDVGVLLIDIADIGKQNRPGACGIRAV